MKRSVCLDHRGAATIEAAIIIPFVFITILNFMFLAFFLFNRCSVDRACETAVLRAGRMEWDSNEERYQKAETGIAEALVGQLLGNTEYERKLEITGTKVSVAMSHSFRGWEHQIEREEKIMQPLTFVRGCRKLERLKDQSEKEQSEKDQLEKN